MCVRLENWSVGPCEIGNGIVLFGIVYGHPKKEDGQFIRSSRIIKVDKRIVTTYNTTYELGEIDPNYLEWCKEVGCHIPTEDEPIKNMDETKPLNTGLLEG